MGGEPMTGKLIVTRGLPGSGKTTFAEAYRLDRPLGEVVRVNRDDLRAMLFGPEYGIPVHDCEEQVTHVQRHAVTQALRRGQDVIVDDTNLRAKVLRGWAELAHRVGVEFHVQDFTDVPLETCVARDRQRRLRGSRSVGVTVIHNMYDRFLRGGTALPDLTVAPAPAVKPYTGTPGKPKAVIIDVDGTLANHGERNPYDTSRYHEDTPHPEIVEQVRLAADAGYVLLVTSGRSEEFRDVTDAWLLEHLGLTTWRGNARNKLIMRKSGDVRNDAIVKLELFDTHIRDNYDVRWAWDDRDRVVEAWRSMGLPVNQVRPGDF
jgi:predicted kinase